MNISRVNGFTPSFGYDKELNKELKEKIATLEDKRWANNLSALNNLCNCTEDSLRLSVRENKTEKTDKFLMLFLRAKEALASCVTETFPELKFADREQASYVNENGVTGDKWLKSAATILDTYTEASSLPGGKGTFSIETPEVKASFESFSQPFMLPKVDSETEQLVEEYVPSKYSPKGFADVAGMSELKETLTENIINPILNPKQAKQDFIDYEKEYPRGLLMYGPPGCGKTYITEALVNEADTKMYKLSLGKAGSSFINQTSVNIKKAFDYVGMLGERSPKPVILFMDELDSIGFDRSAKTDNEDIKQVATLLQAMDDIRSKNVIVIAATNKPDLLDPALSRRFDNRVYVGLPDKEVRLSLLKSGLEHKAKGQKLLGDEKTLEQISGMLEGYSNNAVCNINKSAALNALKRDRADLELCDYEKAIEECNEDKYDEDDYKPFQTQNKSVRKIGY